MRGSRDGFVLVAVLWLLVALGAVGLHAGLQFRSERLAAANALDDARARAAATAGAEYARSRLSAAMLDRAEDLRAEAQDSRRRRDRRGGIERLFSRSDPLEDPWRDPDGLVVPEQTFGDTRFTLALRDTEAALNLNGADEDMLRRFFAVGLELDAALADRLALAIADWRDDDELPRVGGAERQEYLDAGRAVLPPDRPFAELDELRHVMGMTPDIFDAAVPYLTLIGSGRINVNAAPEPVLLALPGMNRAVVQQLVQLRETGAFPRSDDHLFSLLPASAAQALEAEGGRFDRRISFTTSAVEIRSVGTVEGSPVDVQLRMIVTRSDQGALVVSREFDR